MFGRCLTLLLLAALPVRADPMLRDALARLPAAVAEAPDPALASYLAPGVEGGLDPQSAAALVMPRGLEGLLRDPAAFAAASGLPEGSVAWMLAWGGPDGLVTVLGLTPEGLAALPTALAGAGAEDRDDGLHQIGDPLAFDLAARDPFGLWRDHLGRGAIVARDADGLWLAQRAEHLFPAEPSPLVAVLLEGLDAVAPGAAVRQTSLIGPQAGVQTDLGVLLRDPAEGAATLAAPQAGLPPWRLALLADTADGLVQVTLQADCTAAGAAVAAAASAWAGQGATVVASATAGGSVGCAAALRIGGAGYDRALAGVTVSDFPPLRVATGG